MESFACGNGDRDLVEPDVAEETHVVLQQQFTIVNYSLWVLPADVVGTGRELGWVEYHPLTRDNVAFAVDQPDPVLGLADDNPLATTRLGREGLCRLRGGARLFDERDTEFAGRFVSERSVGPIDLELLAELGLECVECSTALGTEVSVNADLQSGLHRHEAFFRVFVVAVTRRSRGLTCAYRAT